MLNGQTFGVVQLAVENKGVKFGTESRGSNMMSVAFCVAWAASMGPRKTVGH